mgnify:CR=1 FL=1
MHSRRADQSDRPDRRAVHGELHPGAVPEPVGVADVEALLDAENVDQVYLALSLDYDVRSVLGKIGDKLF